MAGPLPARAASTGLRQHPSADGNDHATIFRHRNELRGRDDAELGVAPHEQRFQAGQPAALVCLGLVVKVELAVFHRPPQGVLNLQALQGGAARFAGKQLYAVLAAVLGAVHGDVGVPLQGGGVPAVPRVQADADAGGQEQLVAFDNERIPQGF